MSKSKFVDQTPEQMERIEKMFLRTVGDAFVFYPLSKKDAVKMLKHEEHIRTAVNELFKKFSSFDHNSPDPDL